MFCLNVLVHWSHLITTKGVAAVFSTDRTSVFLTVFSTWLAWPMSWAFAINLALYSLYKTLWVFFRCFDMSFVSNRMLLWHKAHLWWTALIICFLGLPYSSLYSVRAVWCWDLMCFLVPDTVITWSQQQQKVLQDLMGSLLNIIDSFVILSDEEVFAEQEALVIFPIWMLFFISKHLDRFTTGSILIRY